MAIRSIVATGGIIGRMSTAMVMHQVISFNSPPLRETYLTVDPSAGLGVALWQKIAKGTAYQDWLEKTRAELDETQQEYAADDPEGNYIYEDATGAFQLTRRSPENYCIIRWRYEIDTDNEIFYSESPLFL